MTDPWRAGIAGLEALGLSHLGVAVSGGGDSMALLAMARDWRDAQSGRALSAATVDHGLRAEARAEAETVAALCAQWSIPHDILTWQDRPKGNLQNAARQARRRLLSDWGRARAVPVICLAHTRDDVAETFLLRLARGSGVDGLARMAARFEVAGQPFARPLLDHARADLRDALTRRGIAWIDDPSNDDPTFDRVNMRRALSLLDEVGISADQIAATATRLSSTRHFLSTEAMRQAATLLSMDRYGTISIDRAAFLTCHAEVQARILARLFEGLSDDAYPPRRAALDRVIGLIAAGQGRETLAGYVVTVGGDSVTLLRERARLPQPHPYADGVIWDGRWRIAGALGQGAILRPTTESDLKPHALPSAQKAALLTAPALDIGTNQPILPALEPAHGVDATLVPRLHDLISR
ncbi:tRNA(Ile)-lysidine synthase [Rubricella aquisinus]|uniref:tRNA(Ile)-lysidine synthase n=1 Tax=Rubricella aquisinus TaxID=2028108 RepID=A0A840X242_9RHOB|nr:tRNA lysidine(34) synthetase TilS [Rubricella aquisinus]MBB5515955.1 tRNA(Ile)-lysidine synthase [Rubricella aquisinus]